MIALPRSTDPTAPLIVAALAIVATSTSAAARTTGFSQASQKNAKSYDHTHTDNAAFQCHHSPPQVSDGIKLHGNCEGQRPDLPAPGQLLAFNHEPQRAVQRAVALLFLNGLKRYFVQIARRVSPTQCRANVPLHR